ncbi:unnamed protein product, partial [Staurois parvus]
HSRVQCPSRLLLFQHGPWQIIGRLFCAWALGENSCCGQDPDKRLPSAYCVTGNNRPSLAFYFFS